MPRPIYARTDYDALAHNLRVARRHTSARILAVVKANAYGHGLMKAAEALNAADGFAVLDIQEAIRLREAGYRQTILLLEGYFGKNDLPLLAEYNLAAVIHSPQQLAWLEAAPRGGKLAVWLKVNTGMNRLGLPPGAVAEAMTFLRRHPAVGEVTLMTHFASADEEAGIAAQLERFNALAAPHRVPRSLANSAALLRYPASHADWVRPGIMLYGASPFAGVPASQFGLRPAMSLHSELIAVRELAAGEAVGYGGTFRAHAPMRIGVVACGYADGYPRHAPTGTPVLVDGQRTRTLGRVSMDMLVVDLSTLPDAAVGAPVTMWGDGLPVEEVAAAAGTISYELLCALAPRVPALPQDNRLP